MSSSFKKLIMMANQAPKKQNRVYWNQKVADYNTYKSRYTCSGASVEYNNGTLILRSNGSSNITFRYKTKSAHLNHKLFVKFEIKSSEAIRYSKINIKPGVESIIGSAENSGYISTNAESYSTFKEIYTATIFNSTYYGDLIQGYGFGIYISNYTGTDVYIKNIQIFDLTQMFGAGNEPSSVEEFYQRIKGIPVDIYAYNEGEWIEWDTEVDTSKYLTIEALEDGLTAKLSINPCQYSFNCIDWHDLPADTETPAIKAGEKVYFKATGLTPTASDGIGTFTISKMCNLLGNCNSMLFGDEADVNNTTLPRSAFHSLFNGNKNLISISENFLPSLYIGLDCYNRMFYNCTNLINTPILPALTVNTNSYFYMFGTCKNLQVVRSIFATTVHSQGMTYMFAYCSSLVTAPELPATTLAGYCYAYMFWNCTSLVSAPTLPADTLANYCYQNMFNNCTNINYIKMLATDISASNCLTNWVSSVSPTGTFVISDNAEFDPESIRGVNGIPEGWDVYTESEWGEVQHYTDADKAINTILESIITDSDVDMDKLVSDIESSDKDFTTINNKLNNIINT